ncbi:MAG: glycerol-3-phosphate acyltransferase [Candidatus Marinimicrobia bacterium]|nr:glycerol-3-phosphate acyltransferase [Candidatus Neomarinimicrobiota bacterium]
MNIYIIYLICLLSGYLTGSILFAYVITKLVKGEDIRDLGNNNPGAANTFKSIGNIWGILTGVLDSSKALVPMLIANYYFDISSISLGLIGIGAIIGHCYPIYFGFKGGRAAATLMGLYLFFIPYELLTAFVVIPLIVFILIKTNRSYWIPFGIISFSAVLCLFFNHTVDVKIIVFVAGFVGLLFNRNYFPTMLKNLLRNSTLRNVIVTISILLYNL